MKLEEYVDELITDPEVGEESWYPRAWMKSKNGPVHVEDHEQTKKLVALCGDEHNDNVVTTANARVMLRRAPACEKCRKAVAS